MCALVEGFSLHAATRVRASDRKGLERLCHYGARGPLAHSRLRELEDGRFSYEMKRPLPTGQTHLVLTGTELLARITPLIPPPWSNLTRYHGVFAPGSKLRPLVVPSPKEEPASEPEEKPTESILDKLPRLAMRKGSGYRIPWASLLKKVFDLDILECAKCGGRMKVLAYIEKPSAVKAILQHLGLPDTALPRERSRGPPEPCFDWGA